MSGETFRGSIHAVAFGLSMTMALHAANRLTEEREKRTHLWVNLCVYTLASGFELLQVRRHWGRA